MKITHRLAAIALLLIGASLPLHAEDCGKPGIIVGKTGKLKTRFFSDGSVAVRAPLAVNPDGGSGSYTVGDHGFTYIANGLAAWRNGKRESCDTACTADFKEAEGKGFAAGTSEFCVFAMEVEPLDPEQARTPCGSGRYVIGNGKGRPKLGAMLNTVMGNQVQSYASTTSLQHLVKGKSQHLDSESLPIAVTPDIALLGTVVWVGGAGFSSSYALIGDKGPAFGEGSIALHQLLRTRSIAQQKSGPIVVGDRCGTGELSLQPPFQARPDLRNDNCKADYKAKSQSDIRAYSGIGKVLDFVILGKAAFQRKDTVIQTTVTGESIKSTADQAGYTPEKISRMLACLPK